MTQSSSKTDCLQVLKERYNNGLYYTYAGDVLVSIRPPSGSNDATKKSQSENKEQINIFTFAKEVYNTLLSDHEEGSLSHSLVMRGVSGSGKTENCKKLFNFWTSAGTGQNEFKAKLGEVYTILEAFGNASTVTNRNSSRFASIVTLFFGTDQRIVTGINVSHFLLDQWRVTDQSKGESNFHIFYNILASQGISPEKTPYRILKNAGPFNDHGMDELKTRQDNLLEAMKVLGFSTQEQTDVIFLLAAILNLGNLAYRRSKYGEVSLDDDSKQILKNSAEVLGLDEEELEECFCSNVVIQSGEKIKKVYSRDEAEDFLDFFLRSIYARLFSWLVSRINTILSPAHEVKSNRVKIDLVDFYGLEVVERNSYEQLFINITEEVLHCMFVEYYLQLVEDEYLSEDLEWMPKTLQDNRAMMSYIIDPKGLLISMDCCIRGSNEPDLSMIVNVDHMDGRPTAELDPKKPNVFTITHFHKEKISYDVRGWSEKNRTKLPINVVAVLKNAENPLLSLIFRAKLSTRGTIHLPENKHDETAMKERNLSFISRYRNSIRNVMERFANSTHVSFVCCIKPSSNKDDLKCRTYVDDYVSKQFEGMGLKDLIFDYKKIHQLTFTFEEFLKKYSALANQNLPSHELCSKILTTYLNSKDWLIGKTKVFLKCHHMLMLSKQLMEIQRQQQNDCPAIYMDDDPDVECYYKVKKISTMLPQPTDQSSSLLSNQHSHEKHQEKPSVSPRRGEQKHQLQQNQQQLQQNQQTQHTQEKFQEKPSVSPRRGDRQQRHQQNQQLLQNHQQPQQSQHLLPRVFQLKPEFEYSTPQKLSKSPSRPPPKQNTGQSSGQEPAAQSSNFASRAKKTFQRKMSKHFMKLYPSLDLGDTETLTNQRLQQLQQRSSDSESDFEDWKPTGDAEKYGEVGSKGASVKWFKATQASRVLKMDGLYADWFHGIISRSKAEQLLNNKPVSCFLIRVAESRLGYSLSFKDNGKCRHYMIDEQSDGKYKVVGEKQVHDSLKDLVEFYQKNKLSNWNNYLTVPCPQEEGECDYAELMMTAREEEEFARVLQLSRVEPSAPSFRYRGVNNGNQYVK